MSFDKKKRRAPSIKPPSNSPEEPPAKVLSLRLPAPLRTAADRYADSTGVSLNGLLCIALADYLASRGYQVKG